MAGQHHGASPHGPGPSATPAPVPNPGTSGDDLIRLDGGVHVIDALDGADRILALDIGASLLEGGAGDDVFRLDGAAAAGPVIVDGEGRNRLTIDGAAPPTFRREAGGDDLHVILGGGTAFDPTRDVVWKDFFDHPLNRVNGLGVAEIEALIGDPGPHPACPRCRSR